MTDLTCERQLVGWTRTRLVVLQPTSFCNISCRYCYVRDRNNSATMSTDVIRHTFTLLCASDLVADHFRVVWHNGEPLTCGVEYFRSAFELIESVNGGRKRISHRVQTNATLMSQEWAQLFLDYGVTPAVSIDGPRFIHDARRVTRHQRGTYEDVMRGIRVLRAAGFPLAGLCVIHEDSLDYGSEIMRFFVAEGFVSLGFIVEEPSGVNMDRHRARMGHETHAAAYETRLRRFYTDAFVAWLPHRDSLQVREFQGTLEAMRSLKEAGRYRVQQEDSIFGCAISVAVDGRVAPFSPQLLAGSDADPSQFCIGNVLDQDDYVEIATSPRFAEMASDISQGIRLCEQSCGYFEFCGGGTPSEKVYELGTFVASETTHCRNSKIAVVDAVLDVLEATSLAMHPIVSLSQGHRIKGAYGKAFARSYATIIDNALHVWDVERLWSLSSTLSPTMRAIADFAELDENCWFLDSHPPTLRNVVQHFRRMQETDVVFPIILSAEGRIMDGAHRLARAVCLGEVTVMVVQFDVTPPADRVFYMD